MHYSQLPTSKPVFISYCEFLLVLTVYATDAAGGRPATDQQELILPEKAADAQPEQAAAPSESIREQYTGTSIAVTGKACRTAGAASTVELWALLLAGRSVITSVAPPRWQRACSAAQAPGAPPLC